MAVHVRVIVYMTSEQELLYVLVDTWLRDITTLVSQPSVAVISTYKVGAAMGVAH